MPSPVTGITQLALTVRDVPRALAFYRDGVGLPQIPIPAPPTMAFLAIGSVRMMISQPEGGLTSGGGTVIYLTVERIADAFAEMRGRGVTFRDEPHIVANLPDREIWLVAFDDPDGNHWALMSEVKK